MPLNIELEPTDLVQSDGRRLALLTVTNTAAGRRAVATVHAGPTVSRTSLDLPHGTSPHWLPIPAASSPVALRVELDGQTVQARLGPVRAWTVHLVNHTHTDLGYTDYQPNVRHDFCGHILEAMALIEQTRAFPEPARFRWTNETAFQLQNFQHLATRVQFRALIDHLRRGTMDVSAGFLHMTDVPGTDAVLRSFRFAHGLARLHRVPVHMAMACDINGLPWVYPAALADLGVQNLSMAINADSARCPLHPPMPFWWEAPDGRRVLVWHGEIYMLGNTLGLDRGVECAQPKLVRHLANLAGRGYAFEHVLLLMSGVPTDTAPPTIVPSLTVRDWNARFVNPKLRLATLTEWFAAVRRGLPRGTPVYRGHWPDYWAFGLGSAADEIRYLREAQHILAAAGTAATHVHATSPVRRFPSEALDAAYDAAEIAAEHTWGSYCSVSRPQDDFTKRQWQVKRDPFYRARLESEQTLDATLTEIGRTAVPGQASVVIHNPLPWPRPGVAELGTVARPASGYFVERLVDPKTSRAVPYAPVVAERIRQELLIPVRDVPATGYVALRVEPDAAGRPLEWARVRGPQNALENRYYRVRVNARTGALQSLYDKQLRRELIRADRDLPFGRIIEEELTPPAARGLANAPDRVDRLRRAARRCAARCRAPKRRDLPGVFKELTFAGTCRGLTGLTATIRLHERTKRIDFEWRLTLPGRTEPQAAYVAFPFRGARPRVWLETPGAAMEPGVDQIPTTCTDFYTVQNFVRLEAGGTAITLVPRDTPLVQLNEISTFHFRERLPRFNGTVVSWLLNNYWNTNFPASQPGEHRFRFSLTSGAARRHRTAGSFRFAYEVANPLHACFVPTSPLSPARAPTRDARGSLLRIEPDNVILISSGPAQTGGGYVFRLQETEGRRTRVVLRFEDVRPRRASVTNLYEENGRAVRVAGRSVRLSVPPHAIATVRVEFA